MKYFSMFSGIGGFELGIQRAFDSRPDLRNRSEGLPEDSTNTEEPQVRADCIGYSEIDKYAIKVYERHFGSESNNKPQTTGLPTKNDCTSDNSDTLQRTASGGRNRGHYNYGDATTINPTELPDFDLLVGGFPCQAFSVAGKRLGFNETRGTLFFDIARILKEKQPRHLVLENVKGLLSHDSGRTFTTIIGVLTDLGYFVEWQVLNSKDFGVPQNRERVFIVGHLGGEPRRKVFPIIGTDSKDIIVSGVLDTETWRKRHEQIRRVHSVEGLSPTIPTGTGGGVMTKIVAPVLTPNRLEKRQNGRRIKNDGEPSFTLTGQDIHGVQIDTRIRRLTPLECERLQAYPDNWTQYGVGDEPISDTQRYKMCGNGVTVNVVQAVIERLLATQVTDPASEHKTERSDRKLAPKPQSKSNNKDTQ